MPPTTPPPDAAAASPAPVQEEGVVDLTTPRRRTAWSLLSSLAIHTSSVAAVLILVTFFRTPPPVGLVGFESIAFTEDAVAQRGDQEAGSENPEEELQETSEDAGEERAAPSEQDDVDVAETLAATGEAVDSETRARVKESDKNLGEAIARGDAAMAQDSRGKAAKARSLQRQIAALERSSARRHIRKKGTTLKRPGADTDGSDLFSTVGSNEVAFIIDVSGSMGALVPFEDGGSIMALDYVKIQLAGLINRQLSNENSFNILTFAGGVRRWRPRLVRANSGAKLAARQFVAGLVPGGGTNLFGALLLAFQDPKVRTIYVLTDGMPTAGFPLVPDQILSRVKTLNRSRKVIIHTVTFLASSGPRDFMRKLAEQNGGKSRAVP